MSTRLQSALELCAALPESPKFPHTSIRTSNLQIKLSVIIGILPQLLFEVRAAALYWFDLGHPRIRC